MSTGLLSESLKIEMFTGLWTEYVKEKRRIGRLGYRWDGINRIGQCAIRQRVGSVAAVVNMVLKVLFLQKADCML